MRTLTLLLALAMLCPQTPAQQTRRSLRPELRGRLAALGSEAAALRVEVAPRSGAASRLHGSVALRGGDLRTRTADFATRFGPLFDADARSSFAEPEIVSRDAAGRPVWVRLRQLVHGFPVAGHALLLRLDGDRSLREAHGVLAAPAAVAGARAARITAEAARTAALSHVQLDGDALTSQPVVTGRAQLAPDGAVQLVQRVEFVRRAGLLPLAVDVDAGSGAVLAVTERRCTGAGTLLWDGVALPFATGKGKGSVYTSVANAAAAKESTAALVELTVVDVSEEALALAGTLTGRYATVADLQAILYNPLKSFAFADSGLAVLGGQIAEYEAFDHVNTYYWITRIAAWLGKVQGGLASDTCLPVIVNFDDGGAGYANAFYSPGDLDGGGGGFGAGFFVFGDFDAVTGDVHDDFSRDPSVVCHEYTHGMVDKAGFTFGDEPLDTPSRAVNEAIADYAAASLLKDPRIGSVFMQHAAADLELEGDALRDLGAPLTLPDNLMDLLGGTTGLPEEHEAGEIFGAALWRARSALKAKLADALILDGLGGWPQGNAEAGFPIVNPGNAAQAYAAFYYRCFTSMMDSLLPEGASAGRQKSAGKLLGAFLAHGITGLAAAADPDDEVLYEFTGSGGAQGLALDFGSAFLGSLTEHRFALQLAAGQTLTLAVKGSKADGTQVDFSCDDEPGDFTFLAPKKLALDGTAASQGKIVVNTTRRYVVSISGGEGGGAYTFKLKLK